ncbi:MAG: hypothetical protein AB8B87_21340 [Granulosicoccus sp.]
MQRRLSLLDLLNQRTVPMFLVIGLGVFPMIVPVFKTLSANQDLLVADNKALWQVRPGETARPLKAELGDNVDWVSSGPDAQECSTGSTPAGFQAYFSGDTCRISRMAIHQSASSRVSN